LAREATRSSADKASARADELKGALDKSAQCAQSAMMKYGALAPEHGVT
jgi:hypothetical protein